MAAIRQAESQTSGQICVHVATEKVGDAQAAAAATFAKQGLAATRHRNAVLILVAPKSRSFAVYGDVGVHQRCGDDFWRSAVAEMEGHFRAGSVTEALEAGIRRIGATLAAHFPLSAGEAHPNRGKLAPPWT